MNKDSYRNFPNNYVITLDDDRKTYPYVFNMFMLNHSPRQQTLGQRMMSWIRYMGINQAAYTEYLNKFAEPWGMRFASSHISQYKMGICSPKVDRLSIMAYAMGVSVPWLCGYGPNGLEPDFQTKFFNKPVLDGIMNTKKSAKIKRAEYANKARVR